MTIEKILIQVREETTGKTTDVEISLNNLITAIKAQDGNYPKLLWCYIEGYIKGYES